MPRRARAPSLMGVLGKTLTDMTRSNFRMGHNAWQHAQAAALPVRVKPPVGPGDWVSGMVMGATGMRRYRLYKPAGVLPSERLPLLVMLHGCNQDAASFALSTQMNRLAARERFLVLYPEQDRRANPQGCWNWYGTRTQAAHGEAAIIMAAIDQVSLLYPVDPSRVAIGGMSAGASMAALLVTRHPARFKALVMHSGVPPGAAHSSVSALGAMLGHRQPSALSADTAWPPLLVIQGGADRVVAASNAHAAVQLWAEASGAKVGVSRQVRRGKRHEMRVTEFKVKGRAVVTLCEVDKLAHAWSGGDQRVPFSDPQGPDASRLFWGFASRQFKRDRS